MNEELTEDVKNTKIELGDKKQDNDMLYEEKESERKEKLQLQQVQNRGVFVIFHKRLGSKRVLDKKCFGAYT